MTSRRIVLGLDGSPGADAAMAWCIEAAPLLDAEVVAVYALPPVARFAPAPFSAASPPYDDEIRELMVHELDSWCKPLDEADVKFRAQVIESTPTQALMDVADETDAAMIVVGRRGHGGFAELVLGSVPHRLSHHALRPVLVVPTP